MIDIADNYIEISILSVMKVIDLAAFDKIKGLVLSLGMFISLLTEIGNVSCFDIYYFGIVRIALF